MKACKTLLLLIFLLSCQIAFTQTINSSITIRFSGGRAVVSGIVGDDFVKKEVIEKIKTQLGDNADFSKLIIQRDAEPFRIDWQTELDKSLLKIKGWKSGVFIFSNKRSFTDKNYPPLREEITGAEISLIDGQKVFLKNYKNKLVVLFFLETWLRPGRTEAVVLNEFYRNVSSRRIEIIGVSTETAPTEKKDFRSLFRQLNIQYKFGWTDSKIFSFFTEFSKFQGIPQTFLILNGRLHAVFIGGGPKTMDKLKETIIKTLDENNL